jgi:3-hydroxymyristoyl/3-hydroxydecanoyl-(acyl carrier protein) dehydratase
MEVNAEPLSMSHGKMVTEHDVLPDAWYLDHGRIPTCIAVEAGQADLFLSAYLGVDFKTKGKAVYRLLDAQVVFHSSLPMPGDVIRYEISLHEFFYQGDMILFRFSFDASVDGKPLMSMAQGCAGFFTEEDLAMGRGVVRPTIATQARVGKIVGDFQSFVKDPPSQLDEGNLDALRRGDYVGCYGDLFADLSLKDPSGLPGDKMRLVHRIKDLEPTGGMYRLGRIVGEADIHPGDWFLTCHFVDDMVMPGTLMYECCLHTLRVFLMGCGWVGERDQMVCEPVPGVVSQLKCRGQVTADTKVVTYEIVVKEIGYRPQAYAIVDALMYADGKPIVDIRDMSLQYPHLNQHSLTNLWDKQKAKIDDAMDLHFMSEQILAFSQSDPTDCFGELYAPFCEGTQRRFARLPRPPYLFLTEAYGRSHDLGVMKAGGNIHGLYRINPAAWYFKSDQSGIMPFAVLLEVGLQTCGFFAAFMGSALTQDDDMFFRNLDGRGTLHRHVKPNDMEITTKVQTTKVVSSGAMIIQEYHFSMFVDHQLVYEGTTNFGFFTRQALGQQSGIVKRQGWLNTASFEKSKLAPFPEGSGLPVGVLLMLDGIDILSIQGGRYGRGFIRGIKEVDPKDWFFQAHFFQDPVMPGTLGLEGAIQALKVFAFEIWGNKRAMEPILGEVHQWSYRGQVLQNSKIMTVEMHVKDIDHDTRTILADGLVSVDGTVIYGVDDFGLRESH